MKSENCICGAPARSRCGNIPGFTVVQCEEPVCGTTGLPDCGVHRHREGTMGYVAQARVTAELIRFTPEGPGVWHWLKTLGLNVFLTARQKANRALREHRSNYPPPAPLPKLNLIIRGRRFESTGNPPTHMEEAKP